MTTETPVVIPTQTIGSAADLLPIPSELQLRNPVSDIPLVGLDNEPLTITVVGIHSAEFFNSAVASKRRAVKAGAKAKEESYVLEDRAHMISDCIVSWSHPSVFGDFTKQRAYELFKQPQWSKYADQIEAHIVKVENFFAK